MHDALTHGTPAGCSWDLGSPAHVSSHTSVKSPAPPSPGTTWPPAPAAPGSTSQLHAPPSPQPGRGWEALGEGPGWGQEGRVPVGRPPVCPRLILAAFPVAWQSGPVAPAVILRFLGHQHADPAAKWGAGGAGAVSRAKGREGDMCWQRGRDGCVCTGGRSVWGCVQPPAWGLPACLQQCGAPGLDSWPAQCACGF